MPVTVTGIPESISRTALVEWLANVGIDASLVTPEGLRVERGAITAEVYALDESGQKYTIGRGDEVRVATHRVCIVITDEEPAWDRE
jgi:hypothetical protein